VAAAEELGIELTIATGDRLPLAAPSNPSLLEIDIRHGEVAGGPIGELDARRRLAAVLAAEDEGALAAALGGRRIGCAANPARAVTLAQDKLAMCRALARAGLPTPWFAAFSIDSDPESAAERVPYPCVLKPTFLSASRGVMRADDEADFVEAFQHLGALLSQDELRQAGGRRAGLILVEGYLPGDEVALEGLLTRGNLQTLAIFDKPDPLEGPFFEETLYVTPSRHPPELQNAIRDMAQRVCRALGLRHGPVHAEFRLNRLGVWPIEIAPRSIGGRCLKALRFEGNQSLEAVILRQALGEPTQNIRRERQASSVMMIPIPSAGRLVSMTGIESARALPGIESIDMSMHAGQRLVPLPEGHQYLGFILAKSDTRAAVEQALRSAYGRLGIQVADGA
jgi:biotin carboxylase